VSLSLTQLSSKSIVRKLLESLTTVAHHHQRVLRRLQRDKGVKSHLNVASDAKDDGIDVVVDPFSYGNESVGVRCVHIVPDTVHSDCLYTGISNVDDRSCARGQRMDYKIDGSNICWLHDLVTSDSTICVEDDICETFCCV